MKIEVLNKIKKNGSKWDFSGRFFFNGQWIPVLGSVGETKTESQMKKAITTKIKRKANAYRAEFMVPKERTLSADAVFKDII